MTLNRKQLAILIAGAIVILAIIGAVAWERTHDSPQGETYYCPMHPTVTSDKPGSCPICGMKLVKRTASKEADVAAQVANSAKLEPGVAMIALSPTQRVMANVKTARVGAGVSSTELVTTGRVTFDERRVAQVSSYAAGRIEQLFVNFTGDHVSRGSAVATIYSPDVYAAQREFLVALASRDRSPSGFTDDLIASSRRRLVLLGVPAGQVDRLARDRKPIFATTIIAPVSGVVTRKIVVPQQSVGAGEPLLEVADLSTVWVEADVYEQDLPRIAVGQRVVVSSPALPGYSLPGRVAFIQPVVTESRTTRVRIDLPNRNLQLRPEMYVTVKLFGGDGRSAITVPATAIIDRGQRQFVWIEVSPGVFSPREVKVGSRAGDRAEIISGLGTGETIVVEGAFLIDSEAQLRNATAGGAGDSHNH